MAQQDQGQDQGPAPPGPLAKGTPWLIGLVIVLFFLSLFFYFNGIGPDRYATIEATRPVLVFTLIAAMLGFGGLLIFRSLFGPPELKERFSNAREIFLVFSGIFGTIIGFYFGAADEEEVAKALSLTVSVAAERQFTVAVEGGSEPFIGSLTLAGQSAGTAITSNERSFGFDVAQTACPDGASIIVYDGSGARGEATVEEARAALRNAGWACPDSGDEAPPPPANAVDDAPGNAAETNAIG